jgi:DNA polymerase bacteriophage-type
MQTSPPAEIVVTPGPRAGTVNLEAVRDGKPVLVRTVNSSNLQKLAEFAEKAGVSLAEVRDAISAAQPAPACAGPGNNTQAGFFVTLRGLHQPKPAGQKLTGDTPLDALKNALAEVNYPAPEPVIEWRAIDHLAALDVDCHDRELGQRPSPAQLETLVACVRPAPALHWQSHGRGLRLIYAAQSGYTAAELAACAAVGVRSLDPTLTVEIVARTRHPAYPRPDYPSAGQVTQGVATADIGELARWMGRDLDSTTIDAWLEEQGYERGKRYDHSRCPVDPLSASHSDPVLVGEHGISCFKCEGTGLTLGSRQAGWFPWVALVGGGVPSRVRTAVRNFCHWEQAKHIVAEDIGLTGALAERIYRALLKAVHGPTDPRIGDAMLRGQGLVRMDGYWVTADLARMHARDGLIERLDKLPAVHYMHRGCDGQEALTLDTERLAVFRGVDDLTRFGYPRVQPVRGMKIYHQWQAGQDPHVVRAVVLPQHLQPEAFRPFWPRYVQAAKRMPLQQAEAILEGSFPGINFPYIRLLIAARGCAESDLGQPPKIIVDGPSGAGKDASVKIAAALIGDNHQDVTWVPSADHFRMAIYEASRSAGLVSCAEIIKLARSGHGDARANLNPLLSYERGATVRLLYMGPTQVRHVPALILTDTSIPRDLQCDEQLGRRFIYVHLSRKVDWQRSALSIPLWRTLKPENAQAANAIVSDVIDSYFAGTGPVVFEDIARQLGFCLLSQSGIGDGVDTKADLLDLFKACCSPGAVPIKNSKWKGRGWLEVTRDGRDPVSEAWRRVCDDLNDHFVESRRVTETDWGQLLGVNELVECDLLANGKSTLGIRFRIGSSRSSGMKVNGEIQPLQQPEGAPEPPPDPPDAPPTPPSSDPGPPEPPTPSTGPMACAMAIATPPAHGSDRALANGVVDSAIPSVHSSPVYIDLETRSACDLPKEGGRKYAKHPTTEILTVAALLDARVIVWTPTLDQPPSAGGLWPHGFANPLPVETFAGPEFPQPLADAIGAGRPLCAHNAFGFDAHVWREKGLPTPADWIDTLPEARAAGYPGALDELGHRLLGHGKDEEGAKLLKKFSQPNARGMFRPFNGPDALKIARYNVADILLLAQLHEIVRGHAEPEVVKLDRTINERGIEFDRVLAQALIKLEKQAAADAGRDVENQTAGALKASDLRSNKKLIGWLAGRGFNLPNAQQETIEAALEAGVKGDALAAQVLKARLTVNRITTGKLERGLAVCGGDGRLRDQLQYHKAHTGRWTSAGMQIHNLPSPHDDLKDLQPLIEAVHDASRFRNLLPPTVSLADAVSSLIRPCLLASPGKVLLIGDFASIEARGVAWCARESTLLQKFADQDVYCDLATRIFGRPVSKEDKLRRKVGKEAVLGCGYGMGAPKFAARCMARGLDLIAAGASAEAVVDGYRDAYPAIAGAPSSGSGGRVFRQGGLWKDIEAAARAAIETGEVSYAGRCQFGREGNALVIKLPSGRRLHYRDVRIEGRVPGYCQALGLPEKEKPTIIYMDPEDAETSTYGGKLTENIVQAICRDLLAAAMLQCETQGLPVVLHVHDEIVAEVDAGAAQEALRHFAKIMATPPTWAEGFPIQVEAFVAERYFKSAPDGAPKAMARNGQVLS